MHIGQLSHQRKNIPVEIQSIITVRERHYPRDNYLVYTKQGFYSFHIRHAVALETAKNNNAKIVDLHQ